MTFRNCVYLTTLIFILGGCGGPAKPALVPLTEAHKKFVEICKKDYQLNVKLFPLKNTVWIYLPIDHPIVDYKATEKKAEDTKAGSERFNVNFLETAFKDGVFTVEHDISMVKSYPKDYGYASNYTEEYNTKYRAVFSAVMQAYFSVGVETGENIRVVQLNTHHKAEGVPEFFVISIADTSRGIQIQFLMNLEDYRKQAAGHLPPEEYTQRIIYEMSGNPAIVGDLEGSHLDYREVAWGEFLAGQITGRVNFKYGRSSFPPSADTKAEILHQVYRAVSAYDFQGFSAVELHDLRDGSTVKITREELQAHKKAPLPEGGKLHTIKFF